MKRAYYSNNILDFLLEPDSSILGELTAKHSNRTLEELQVNAWRKQISVLKDQLSEFEGQIYLEFAIPRMGKRVDNIVIIDAVAFIIEFKVGDGGYEKHAIEQVIDYTIDLKNFHEGSHNIKLIPVLVATNATSVAEQDQKILAHKTAAKSNQYNLINTIKQFLNTSGNSIDIDYWESSIYKPTPTIVEATQALYKGHNVKEITRSDSGTINLSKTADCINSVIEKSKVKGIK